MNETIETITGYKFIRDDLTSRHGNQQWEIGKWVQIDRPAELELCVWGFHASKSPLDVLTYVYGNRFFQVEARGKIIHDRDKFVATEMRLVKEIPDAKQIFVEFARECARRAKEHAAFAANAAARAAAFAANAAADAADDAANAAFAADDAADDAADAAHVAAHAAARAAAAADDAADAAYDAARAAAHAAADAAYDAARAARARELTYLNKFLKTLIIHELEGKA